MSTNLAYSLWSRFLDSGVRLLRTTTGSAGLALILLASAGSVRAENVLQDITFAPGPGGQVDVMLKLAEPPADPKLFTTQAPARIAIDFENTRAALKERKLTVGVGAANTVSAVDANGRTRVVVDLFHPASYSTRIDGTTLVLSIGSASGSAAVTSLTSNDPSKASGAAGRPEVSNIDFRRGKNGEGRLIISFSGDGVSADLQRSGTKVTVELSNVRLPDKFAQRLDVTDFATPVQSIETRPRANGARIELNTTTAFEQLAYQTGNEYVVEVTPLREDSAEAKAREIEYAGERVTFNFQDIPVRSVLQLIADVSELNVVVSDTVTGNVTLRLINVPWDQALDIILRTKGLDKRRQGNVIWVAPTAEISQREQALEDARIALEDRAEVVTEFIPINYANAKEIADLLTKGGQTGPAAGAQQGLAGKYRGFLSSRGSISFDERTNTLLVNDIPRKIREIKELIALLDRPVDQVLIEARIAVAGEDFSHALGAKFGVSAAYEDGDNNLITTSGTAEATDTMNNLALLNRLNGSDSSLPVSTPGGPGSGILVPSLLRRLNVNLPITNAAGTFGLAILSHDYLLDLELSALETEGRGQVVSSPRVITANNQEAVIRQGDEVGYVTIAPQQGGNNVPIPNVQFKEVLLELKVTPTITQDQRVYLVMNVKKDEVSGFINTSIGQVPQIAKREINTAVLVENGQTVVLGGVYEFRNTDDVRKVPFLGDLPFLGNLFKIHSTSARKAELLIFVTPKILLQSRR